MELKQFTAIINEKTPKSTIVGFTYYQDADKFLNKTYADENGRDRNRTYESEFGTDIKRWQTGRGLLGLSLDYKKVIENAIRKAGGEVPEWETQGLRGFHWVKGYENLILQNDKDGRYAIRIYGWASSKVWHELNGNEVPEETFKGYIKPKKVGVVKCDGEVILDENGKEISMKGITPKIYYIDHIVSLKICGTEL